VKEGKAATQGYCSSIDQIMILIDQLNSLISSLLQDERGHSMQIASTQLLRKMLKSLINQPILRAIHFMVTEQKTRI